MLAYLFIRRLAGKSTVLNALIGSRVLPTSNVPETARITRLRHSKQCVEPVLAASGGGQPIVGADAVHAHLEMLNRQVPAQLRAFDLFFQSAASNAATSAAYVYAMGRRCNDRLLDVGKSVSGPDCCAGTRDS